MRLLIVDGKRLVLWAVGDPSVRLASPGEVALWTDAPDFVATAAVLFEHLWRAAGTDPGDAKEPFKARPRLGAARGTAESRREPPEASYSPPPRTSRGDS